MSIERIKPGMRVRVIQTIRRRDGDWRPEVTGEVLAVRAEKTGSWYAHSSPGRLLLCRLELRKDDGEVTRLTLDSRSKCEVIGSGV